MKPYSDTEGPHWLRLFQLGRGVFITMLTRSPHIDSFSTWLLVTTGVTTGFFLSHLTELASHLSSCAVRVSLLFLAASAVFGLFEKVLSFMVATEVAAEQGIMQHTFQTLGQSGPELQPSDIQRLTADVIKEIRDSSPRLLHRLIDSGARKGAADPLFAFKRTMKHMFFQSLLCLIQLLFLVLALIALALGLR